MEPSARQSWENRQIRRGSRVRILIVDDDLSTRKMVRFILEQEAGHEVLEADRGDVALAMLRDHAADLVVLDVMMPDLDGVDLCRRIRQQSGLPILMLSARDHVTDRVRGLRNGADDYLGKPFDPSELLARVNALLRRAQQTPALRQDTLRVADLVVDLINQTVTRGNEPPVSLTPTELRLLVRMASAPGRPWRRKDLLIAIWGTNVETAQNTVDSYISDLRRKIEPDPRHPQYIRTVRGIGYRFL
jgi:two-component system response regulator MtrA